MTKETKPAGLYKVTPDMLATMKRAERLATAVALCDWPAVWAIADEAGLVSGPAGGGFLLQGDACTVLAVMLLRGQIADMDARGFLPEAERHENSATAELDAALAAYLQGWTPELIGRAEAAFNMAPEGEPAIPIG